MFRNLKSGLVHGLQIRASTWVTNQDKFGLQIGASSGVTNWEKRIRSRWQKLQIGV